MIPKTSGKIFCGLTRRKLNCFKALCPVTVGIKPTVFQQSSMVVVVWCSDLLYCFRLTSCRWCNHEFCFLPENQEGKYLAVSPWLKLQEHSGYTAGQWSKTHQSTSEWRKKVNTNKQYVPAGPDVHLGICFWQQPCSEWWSGGSTIHYNHIHG